YRFRIFDSNNNGLCCAFGNGYYEVKNVATNLIVASGASFTAADSGSFCVPQTNVPPSANFSYSSANICAGDTVFFTDQSFNSPTSWVWTFNGGNPSFSVSQNPYAVYQTPGVYSVSLTVSNSFGNNTVTLNNIITVTT